ncbi:MAG: hypothetical protein ACLPSW_29110 [Roseiarcus sp.]|jgi:hypothetical protein
MNCRSCDRQKLIEQLRFALPLKARARPPLIERLRKSVSCDAARSNLPVTNVFDVGEGLGLMCQLDLTQYCPRTPYLVVPLEHLALDRRYGLDRKPQHYRRRVARAAPQAS